MSKFLNVLKSHWISFALICGLTTVGSIYFVDIVNEPKNEEKMTVFCASLSMDQTKISEDFKMENYEYLREINFLNSPYNGTTFASYYSVYGIANSDIVILPESKLDKDSFASYYAPISSSFGSSNFGDAQLISNTEANENFYGIKVHDKTVQNNDPIMYSNEELNEDYYAFFIKGSLHIGELSSSCYSTAIEFVKLLLSYEN